MASNDDHLCHYLQLFRAKKSDFEYKNVISKNLIVRKNNSMMDIHKNCGKDCGNLPWVDNMVQFKKGFQFV